MKETIKTKIIQFMEESRKKSFSMEEIAEALQLQKSEDFKNLVQTVAAMEREGSILFNKKGKVKLPMQRVLVEGTFRANERGFGFVSIDEEEEDIYIPKESTGYAMDGDTVAIDILHAADPFPIKGQRAKSLKSANGQSHKLSVSLHSLMKRRSKKQTSMESFSQKIKK